MHQLFWTLSVLSDRNKFIKYEVLFYVCSPEGPNEVNSHDIVPCLSFWACFLNFVQNIEGKAMILHNNRL